MGAHNIELRDQPAYTLAEAARYLKLPAATLRSWTIGRDYPTASSTAHFQPLIHAAKADPTQLSFYNLIEAHVLRALRVDHGVQSKRCAPRSVMRNPACVSSASSCTRICALTLERSSSISMASSST